MKKIVVIHQPDFLPYLGFFHRLLHADLWIVFDNAQFAFNGWNNRDKIKTPNGEKWLTVSLKKYHGKVPINKIILSDEINWKESHLNLITHNYKKSQFFDEIFPYIKRIYEFDCELMIDFNLNSIQILMKLFDIHIPFLLASSLNPEGKSNELLVDILAKVKATTYLSGVGAKAYFKPESFDASGIKVEWQDFKHPVYPQLFGDFIQYLSSIDLLFNCGIEKSREILRSC